MASRKLTAKTYIEVDGKTIPWYEIDEDGKVTWFLPKEEGRKYRDRMLKNIGEQMSRYAYAHPESL